MDIDNLKNTWQSYNNKSEDTWLHDVMKLNMDLIEALQTQKAKSALNKMIWVKVLAIIIAIPFMGFLGYLLYYSMEPSKIFFIICDSAILILTGIAVVVNIKHLVWIRHINNSKSVVDTQNRLAQLQLSTMHITRLLWLQAPFYSFFFLSPAIIKSMSLPWMLFQLSITGLITLFAIWLFRNINYRNAHKKWFKLLFSTPEWTGIISSMAFLKEIEDFRRE